MTSSQVSIFVDPQGRMGVKTPYNPTFVQDFKRAVPSARWDSYQRIWFFDPISKDQAEMFADEEFSEAWEISE